MIPSKHNRVKKLGQQLHTDKTGDFIIYIIDKLKEWNYDDEYNILFSYVLGFITHYALDTSMHPFIYYFGGIYDPDYKKTKKYEEYHRQLEKIIGFIELEKKKGPSAYKIPLYEQINLGECVPSIIKRLYFNALNNVYNLEIKNYLINYCYKDMKNSLKFFTEPNGITEKIFSVIEWIIKKSIDAKIYIYPRKIKNDLDYLNNYGKKWSHPCDYKEVTNKTGEELYNEGVKKGKDMINAIIEYVEGNMTKEELKEFFPNISYESGKLLAEHKKMIYFNCIFE